MRRLRYHTLWATLFIVLTSTTLCWSWTDEISSAMNALASEDGASDEQKALAIEKNAVMNRMRIKDVVSDASYQASQNHYSEVVQDSARKAAKKHGLEIRVQTPTKRVFDAGTDSDLITNAKDPEQVAKLKKSFNEEIDKYLIENGRAEAAGKNWTKELDVDFMSDPDSGISEGDFKRVGKLNNDAYSDPDAARYEIKSREEGSAGPNLKETKAYMNEMRSYVAKKRKIGSELAVELRQINLSPKAQVKGSEQYARRMDLEAQLQQSQAQQAKYFDRMNKATSRMATLVGTEAPEMSQLPEQGQIRAASEDVSAQKRQIDSATVAATADHALAQSKMNEALLLSLDSTRSPDNAKANNQRIALLVSELPPAQQGDVITQLLDNRNISSEVSQSLKENLQTINAGKTESDAKAINMSSSYLGQVGKVAGWAGDLMSIQQQLDKAKQGSHLFINLDENDGEATKNLKRSLVALIELSPVPIIESLERGWAVDERVKREILEKIANGEAIDPALVTAEVLAEIGIKTVGSMTIDPLLSGMKATEEGYLASRDMFKNWQDDALREESERLQQEKFNDILARIEAIDLGVISAVSIGTDGRKSYVLDDVQRGDHLEFSVPRSERWIDAYQVKWEIKNPQGQKFAASSFKKATDADAHHISYDNSNLAPGRYVTTVRVFNGKTGKQMDSANYAFNVSGHFDMGALAVHKNNGNTHAGTVLQGDILRFTVDRVGTWSNKYNVEWFVAGELLKQDSASSGTSHQQSITFDDRYPPGQYSVSIRALKGKKIVSFRKAQITVEPDIDYEKRGRERRKEVVTTLVEQGLPGCLSAVRGPLLAELLSTPLSKNQALAWGTSEDYSRGKSHFERDLLQGWVNNFPALPKDDCTLSYAQSVANLASQHGVGSQEALFAQLSERLVKDDDKENQQVYLLAQCKGLKQQLDGKKQKYTQLENQYISLYKRYLSGARNHSEIQAYGNRLNAIKASGTGVKDAEAYNSIVDEYNSVKSEMMRFADSLDQVSQSLSGDTTECQSAIGRVGGQSYLFDEVLGAGRWDEFSSTCSEMTRMNQKSKDIIQQATNLKCGQFGDQLRK